MDALTFIGLAAVIVGVVIFLFTFRRFVRSSRLEECFKIAVFGGIAGGAFVGAGLLCLGLRLLFLMLFGG